MEKLDGEYKQWYIDNGQLAVQKYFKDGKLDEEYKQWFESNGQLEIQTYYKDGE